MVKFFQNSRESEVTYRYRFGRVAAAIAANKGRISAAQLKALEDWNKGVLRALRNRAWAAVAELPGSCCRPPKS